MNDLLVFPFDFLNFSWHFNKWFTTLHLKGKMSVTWWMLFTIIVTLLLISCWTINIVFWNVLTLFSFLISFAGLFHSSPPFHICLLIVASLKNIFESSSFDSRVWVFLTLNKHSPPTFPSFLSLQLGLKKFGQPFCCIQWMNSFQINTPQEYYHGNSQVRTSKFSSILFFYFFQTDNLFWFFQRAHKKGTFRLQKCFANTPTLT